MTRNQKFFIILLIIITAINLRPSLAVTGALLPYIEADLSLSAAAAGFLTTLPLIAFAVLSPAISRLAIHFGENRMLLVGMAVLTAGILIRVSGNAYPLYAGTILIGFGIAAGNVLIPGVIKEHFPDQIGSMTGLFTTSMSVGSALSTAICVPLVANPAFGWRGTFMIWAAPAAASVILWFFLIHSSKDPSDSRSQISEASGFKALLHNRLAWYVTCFMGFQSFLFYCMLTWLPQILMSHGITAEAAGYFLSLYQLISLPASLITPILAKKHHDQVWLVIQSGILYLASAVLFIVGRSLPILILAIVMIGYASGTIFCITFMFFGLRSRSQKEATELSGMAQSVGYLMASIGPVLFGSIYDCFHTWTIPLLVFIAVTILMMLFGSKAGQDKKLS